MLIKLPVNEGLVFVLMKSEYCVYQCQNQRTLLVTRSAAANGNLLNPDKHRLLRMLNLSQTILGGSCVLVDICANMMFTKIIFDGNYPLLPVPLL